MRRRDLLKSTVYVGAAGLVTVAPDAWTQTDLQRAGGTRIKVSCNLYSFNGPLTKGYMTLDEVLDFCAGLDFAAVDPTGYYFPNYPKLPPDEYVYHIKRKALLLGLGISGTGVRNDFTDADESKREESVALVRSWIECAVRLGAPMVRVFAGSGVPEGHTREEALSWVVEGLRRCAGHGEKNGIMVVLQNHNDFIQTPEDVLTILSRVHSDWLRLNVDIGSFRAGDPYEAVSRVAQHAITWQIKQSVFLQGRETETDLSKIAAILKDIKYRGYIQLETLGNEDPRQTVPPFLEQLLKAIS